MSLNFIPDYYFNKFSEADAAFLSEKGYRGIVLDVDNTLEPYENIKPGSEVMLWYNSLRKSGISMAIVSNNSKERIDAFNEELKIPAYSKAHKPFAKNIKLAMQDMGTSPETTVFMGDQIFTDVWAAHNAGIAVILVPPIKDKTDLFTRFKRLLETPFLKKYFKSIDKTRQTKER